MTKEHTIVTSGVATLHVTGWILVTCVSKSGAFNIDLFYTPFS